MDSLSYFKSLTKINGRKPAGRKAWSIDLETVWIPFFTASNTVGATQLPPEALGAPLRLAYDADGSVRFSRLRRPITKVAKDLADNIRSVRENFTATMVGHTAEVISKNKAGYKKQVELAKKAGEPIIAKDRANLEKAIAEAMEEAIAKAEAEAKAEAKAEAEAEGKEKVPVTA